MKKIGLLFKEISGKLIKTSLKSADAVFIVRNTGISSPDLSGLRKELKSLNAALFVVRNSVAQRAFKDSKLELLVKNIEGPCGLVFIKEEPVSVSRILCNFAKEHEQLKLTGGFLKDRILEKSDIESLSKLPSKEALRAQVVMALNSPISGLAIALNQILTKFVCCLDQIKQKKSS